MMELYPKSRLKSAIRPRYQGNRFKSHKSLVFACKPSPQPLSLRERGLRRFLLPFALPFQEASHREKGLGDEGSVGK